MTDEYETVLREIYSVIADAELEFEQKVAELLEIGVTVLDTEYGALSYVEGNDYIYEIVHDPEGETQPGDVVPLGETNCERAIETEETLVLTDIATEAPDLATRAGFTDQGIECYIGTPVTVEGRIYGTFCFYDREVRSEPFSEWEITLVDFMGKWISYELERERREAELTRQRDQLKDVARIIAHDLRNPLQVAVAQLHFAREQFGNHPSSDHPSNDHPSNDHSTNDSTPLDEIEGALTRMGEIIDAVLALARVGQQNIGNERLDLKRVVTDAKENIASDNLSLIVEDELGTVFGDEGLVKQLFENLLRNAIEHAGPNPTVQVGPLDDRPGFYFEDDGPGIPESEREQVFQGGYSTQRDGTGFGLNIVAEIAEVHDWSVSLTEASTGGARFEIEDTRRA